MTINPYLIIALILAGLGLVALFFIFSSKRWHDPLSGDLQGKPVTYQISHTLRQMGISDSRGVAAAQQITRIVDSEIDRVTQEIHTEMGKVIEQKEKEVQEIQGKIETVEHSYKQLGKQKEQTESVVRSIAKGVIVLDDEGKVVYLNPTAEKILNVKTQEITGKQIGNVTGEHVVSLVNDEGVEENAADPNAKGKEELKENTAVIETIYGQTKGVLSIPAGQDYRQKVENFKNEFLARISHELRTPLICIQKSLQTLAQTARPEEQKYFEIAVRNAEKLDKLINEILDLSKLESGQIHLVYEFCTLGKLAGEIRKKFSAWAGEKGIELIFDIPGDEVAIEADEFRLVQVLSQFMSNALKFSPKGGKVVLRAQRLAGTGTASLPDRVEIGVRDSGPGIEAEELKQVFKKFAYVNTQATAGEKGTGIGLAMSKEIIDLHRGRIWAESKPGQGSYFAFSIPLRKPA